MKKIQLQKFIVASVIAGASVMSACGGPSSVSSPSPRTGNDVVPPGDGVLLGSGWYPIEHYQGLTFRWATNDAEVTACPDANNRTLAMMLDPGPGAASKPFILHVKGNQGDSETTTVREGQFVRIAVGEGHPAETFVLHADTHNLPTPHDPRVLNFRARTIALGSTLADCKNDVVFDGSPLTLGNNWFPYETYRGQSFRWITNNAQVRLTANEPTPFTLEADLEPGPSLGGAPLQLRVRDTRGGTLAQSSPLRGRAYVEFRLPAEGAGSVLSLSLSRQSKNVAIPKDKRILNFRVFSLKIKA